MHCARKHDGHSLGACVAMAYVEHETGVDDDFIAGGRFEVEQAGALWRQSVVEGALRSERLGACAAPDALARGGARSGPRRRGTPSRHGNNTLEPVVRRASRSRCALTASASA